MHAHLTGLHPGTQYHYRFRYAAGHELGTTADATFLTAPRGIAEPFTFTAFADEGIPGPSLDRDPLLLPESDWEEWNNGSYDPWICCGSSTSRAGSSTGWCSPGSRAPDGRAGRGRMRRPSAACVPA